MKNKILLILNNPIRETPIMEKIKEEILLLDGEIEIRIEEICTIGPTEFNKILFKFRPKVILTFPFLMKDFSSWFYFGKKFLKFELFTLRAEGVVDFNSSKNISWHLGFDSYGKNFVDYEMFWGRKSAQVLGDRLLSQNKISSANRIKVVGYPRLESYFEQKKILRPLPIRISEAIKYYDRNKIILITTGFHFADYTTQDFFQANDLDAENDLDDLLEFAKISKLVREEWTANIIISANNNKSGLIIVKKHPNEHMHDYQAFDDIKNILLIEEKLPIEDIVKISGMLIHYGSTTAVDAWIEKMPVIYLYSRYNGIYYSDYGWPAKYKALIGEMSCIIGKYIAGEVIFDESSEADFLYNEIFDITRSNPYTPSAKIARLLIGNSLPQHIGWIDLFLWKSIYFFVKKYLKLYLRNLLKQ